MTYTLQITTKQIYGVNNPAIPDGFKVVGFRPPKDGDAYIPTNRSHISEIRVSDWNWAPADPRIIVQYSRLDTHVSHKVRSGRVKSNCDEHLGAVAA